MSAVVHRHFVTFARAEMLDRNDAEFQSLLDEHVKYDGPWRHIYDGPLGIALYREELADSSLEDLLKLLKGINSHPHQSQGA